MKSTILALGMTLFASLQANAAGPAPLTAGQRVEGVSIIWQQINRQFPIRQGIGEFEAKVNIAKKEVIDIESIAEYYASLDRLVASLNDGHTFIRAPAGSELKRSKPSVGVGLIEDRVVVTWVRDDLARTIPLGSNIRSVDGEDPFQIAQERRPRVSASTAHRRNEIAMSRILEGTSGTIVGIEYITPLGERRKRDFERGQAWPKGATVVFLQDIESKRIDFKLFDDGKISYFSIRDFRDRFVYFEFVNHLAAVRDSGAIIFDVRKNSGGDSAFGLEILSHFLTSPMREGSTRKTSFRIAAEAAGSANTSLEYDSIHLTELPQDVVQPRPEAERVAIPMVVLMDHDTLSAAEDFVSFASALGARRVGETTAGSTGEMARVSLPGGGTLFALIKWDKSVSGDEFVGLGFRPHVPSSPTLSDLLAGRDTILSKGLEVARSLVR